MLVTILNWSNRCVRWIETQFRNLSFAVERREVLKSLTIKVYSLYSNMNYSLYKATLIHFDRERAPQTNDVSTKEKNPFHVLKKALQIVNTNEHIG